jgi:hypothetical protein
VGQPNASDASLAGQQAIDIGKAIRDELNDFRVQRHEGHARRLARESTRFLPWRASRPL